jgi:hypothetical protein
MQCAQPDGCGPGPRVAPLWERPSGRDAGGCNPGLLQDLHRVFGRWLGTPHRGEDAAPTHSPATTLASIQMAMSASPQLGS